MTKTLLVLAGALLLSSVAQAQDYGLTVGIHQTSGSIDNSPVASQLSGATGSVSGKLGFDAGLTFSMELLPNIRFRSGLLYDQRQFDYKLDGALSGHTIGLNFYYLDVPVNVQYNFTPMIGVYGGLIVGIHAGDSVTKGGITINPDPGQNVKSMYPLINVGANFMFNDMIGIDLFFENGLGAASDNVKNFSTFGMHFIYWL